MPSLRLVDHPALFQPLSRLATSVALAMAWASSLQAAEITAECIERLARLPGGSKSTLLAQSCARAESLEGCKSVEGTSIFHVDRLVAPSSPDDVKHGRKRVLIFSLIHGDELPSGTLARDWLERLEEIEPRNDWRIVPILNPDGVARKTRMNARGVDLNRNFPTQDWSNSALQYWRKEAKRDPRRYPGEQAGSEPETLCALKHIDAFKPDFIASIHTPYNVLDFDGPSLGFPRVESMRWRSIGTFPGSLGRFMWHDRQIPVLTVELKTQGLQGRKASVDRLQDVIGTLARQAAARAPVTPPAPATSLPVSGTEPASKPAAPPSEPQATPEAGPKKENEVTVDR